MNNYNFPLRSNVISSNGVAATSHPLATLEAIEILKKGGNAVDAAIAASAVLSAVEPNATGIGGDCFAIVVPFGKKPLSYNGSGINPKKASFEFFKENKITSIGLESPHSVTIPGAINAWSDMHKDFGKLDFEELFLKAIYHCENGFNISEKVALSWQENIKKLSNNKNSQHIFLNNGQSYKVGEKFSNPKLAETLRRIGKKGAKEFYESDITLDIVTTLNELGGVHNVQDFRDQKTITNNTIYAKYKDVFLHQCPPNGPGITALMMMKLMEKLNINEYLPMSFERFHLEAEVTKLCYKIREKNIGDPNFVNMDINQFLSSEQINKLVNKISLKSVNDIGNLNIPAHPETTYLTVVDRDLTAVSFINSICYAFGSGITTNKTGILLQNRGVNFRIEENHPNCIGSLKRPLHTIIPGIVLNNHKKIILSYGVMGGQYQPVGHTHVLNNIFDYLMSVQEALDFPRAFYYNNSYMLENGINENVEKKLFSIGHKIKRVNYYHGGGQAIKIDYKNGSFIGGSDSRKDGCALGL